MFNLEQIITVKQKQQAICYHCLNSFWSCLFQQVHKTWKIISLLNPLNTTLKSDFATDFHEGCTSCFIVLFQIIIMCSFRLLFFFFFLQFMIVLTNEQIQLNTFYVTLLRMKRKPSFCSSCSLPLIKTIFRKSNEGWGGTRDRVPILCISEMQKYVPPFCL